MENLTQPGRGNQALSSESATKEHRTQAIRRSGFSHRGSTWVSATRPRVANGTCVVPSTVRLKNAAGVFDDGDGSLRTAYRLSKRRAQWKSVCQQSFRHARESGPIPPGRILAQIG